jgi:hypothetical protein
MAPILNSAFSKKEKGAAPLNKHCKQRTSISNEEKRKKRQNLLLLIKNLLFRMAKKKTRAGERRITVIGRIKILKKTRQQNESRLRSPNLFFK